MIRTIGMAPMQLSFSDENRGMLFSLCALICLAAISVHIKYVSMIESIALSFGSQHTICTEQVCGVLGSNKGAFMNKSRPFRCLLS